MIEYLSKKNTSLDLLILLLILGITFVDTINGVLVTNDFISVSKPYKFLILVLMILKMATTLKVNKIQLLILISFSSFFIGYFGYFLTGGEFTLLVQNFIESVKYFIWPISFVYFSKLYSSKNTITTKLVYKIIGISYLVLLANIFIGLLGFGYQFYPRYDTGVKGFFFSGNEFSLLFILLTFFTAWKIHLKSSLKYYVFMIFSLFLAFNIGSKTTILGVIGIFFIILISNTKVSLLNVKPKRIALFGGMILTLPLLGWAFIRANQNYFDNFIFKRLKIYNYDFVTWVLSKRNLVAKEGFEVFGDLNMFSKFFGQGEESFQSNFDIIELDFIDLFLNHGYLGFICYFLLILVVLKNISRSYKKSSFNRALLYLYIMIIFFLANLAGHIINTGIPGFFIGMIFAMHNVGKFELIKNNKNEFFI